jgi:HEAT repeat protein
MSAISLLDDSSSIQKLQNIAKTGEGHVNWYNGRDEAILALARLKNESIISYLKGLEMNDYKNEEELDYATRPALAINALGILGTEKATKTLVALALKDPQHRKEYAKVLGGLRHVNTVVPTLKSRMVALDSLSRLSRWNGLSLVRAGNQVSIKKAETAALKTLESDPEFAYDIIESLGYASSNSRTRSFAKQALENIKPKVPINTVMFKDWPRTLNVDLYYAVEQALKKF